MGGGAVPYARSPKITALVVAPTCAAILAIICNLLTYLISRADDQSSSVTATL